MLGKNAVIGLTVAAIGVAIAIVFGVQAENSTKCDPSEMSHSATDPTAIAYENQANRYCSHPPDDALAVPADLGVFVAVGGAVYAAVSESRRRKLASAVARRATLAYTGFQESRARQAQEREAQAQAEADAEAEAKALAQAAAAAVPPPPAPSQEFAGNSSPAPVYDYPAYAGESVQPTGYQPAPSYVEPAPAPVEEDSTPPPAPAPSSNGSNPFGRLF